MNLPADTITRASMRESHRHADGMNRTLRARRREPVLAYVILLVWACAGAVGLGKALAELGFGWWILGLVLNVAAWFAAADILYWIKSHLRD